MVLCPKRMNSFAFAIYVFSGLGGYLFKYLNISNSFLTINILIGIASATISVVAIFINKKIYINRETFLFMFFLLLVVTISIYILNSSYSLIKFLYYVVFGIIILLLPIDIEYVLRILTVSSVVWIPFYDKLFESTYISLNQADMGLMYKLLNIVLASILHFFFYRKESKKYIWIGYISSLVLIIGMIVKANRGVFLSLIFIISVCLINRRSKTLEMKKNIKNKRNRLIILTLFLLVLVINFENIIFELYRLFSSLTTNVPSFLVKMQKYLLLNDTSNGRKEVYELAFSIIRKNPIGIGIRNFSRYSIYSYPHNFILQLLIEGGIPFLLVPLICVCVLVKNVFFEVYENKNIQVEWIFMLCLILPRFLVSLDIWVYSEFWIPIFYVLISKKKKDRKTILGKERNNYGNM